MPQATAHRLLIADDDPAIRASFRALFATNPEFELVGEAADGSAAVSQYRTLRPAVVLMDLQMPEMTGIEATTAICSADPGACVVAMTSFDTRDYVVAALRAGAAGYLLKGSGGPALFAGLRQALAGEMPLASTVRRQLVATIVEDDSPTAGPVQPLTQREAELISWLAHGLTNQQIAQRMHLSEGSVKQYLARIGTALGVSSRTQVLVRSIQLGLVDPKQLPPITDHQ